MTEKRQRMISAMKYILLVIIVGYLVILMLYASGSKRAFSEVSKALSSVLDSKELVQMDDQMLKRNYGLNSADYKGVLYYSSPSSISAAEVLVIQVKNDAQIENVTNAIAQRKAQRIEDFDSYLPEQVKLLEDSQEIIRGRYIFFAVSSKASEYRSAFDKSMKGEQMLFSKYHIFWFCIFCQSRLGSLLYCTAAMEESPAACRQSDFLCLG